MLTTNTFRDSLINIRNDEINLLIEAHDAELRALLGQVNLETLRMELYAQAGRLFSTVEAVQRISVDRFLRRHISLLQVKKAEHMPYEFYRRYPNITLLLERLRAEFTGMVVTFEMDNDAFVFRVSGVLALPLGETGGAEDCSIPVLHCPVQS